MGVARAMVRGCDVWLNTPRRPLEASAGTSGMKAAVNGVLNVSVLDGWWAEGYSPDVGWAIDGTSDEADREQLYRRADEFAITANPCALDRDDEGVDCTARAALRCSAVIEYVERYYLAAHASASPLSGYGALMAPGRDRAARAAPRRPSDGAARARRPRRRRGEARARRSRRAGGRLPAAAPAAASTRRR